ncbi:GNAT family N-acetyltransferase [Nocardiopsis algeriensis]|uniref:Ribosomal-protein-serine acetyltransferase n=1 Tax=Nocardiopsis algeriensis TaxID=1478215 RepID=A0A841ILY3_9ACTN|nr:GNAT family protein [Nocardiopsis algeriensis]MBB6119747.1 ribosomal-protein-serine acetyltransferase [Nocardiopsis algeriensis]
MAHLSLDALPPTLPTRIPGVSLRVLTSADSAEYRALLRANRAHLTRHGDFTDQVGASAEEIEEELAHPGEKERAYGIRLHGTLVGRVGIIAVAPPHYGLGYWLAQNATGHGRASAACAALVESASAVLGATDMFAGVTHGNDSSAALLRRLGFTPVAEFPTYTRFRLALTPPGRQGPRALRP